jgi:transposase
MSGVRGGLTSKIHAVVDTKGLPVRLALTTGERTTTVSFRPAVWPEIRSNVAC